MHFSEQQWQDFEDFFSGRMQPDRKAAFYLQLAGDLQLQEAFELEKSLRQYDDLDEWTSIPLPDREKVDRLLQLLSRERPGPIAPPDSAPVVPPDPTSIAPPDPTPVVPLRPAASFQVAVAAAIVFIFLISYLIVRLSPSATTPPVVRRDRPVINEPAPDTTVNTDKGLLAYNSFYHRYTPGRQDPIELQYSLGLYSDEKYDPALHSLNDFAGSRGSDLTQRPDIKASLPFYKALCYLSLLQPDRALPLLQQAHSVSLPPGPLAQNIDWYLALCQLRLGHAKEAVELLQFLQQHASGEVKINAGRLLEALK